MIKVDKLNFGFTKKKLLFNGLYLRAEAGNIYGLLGKNGAGKTTLLNVISGLLSPSAGKVDVMDFNPRDRSPLFLEKLMFVPEDFDIPAISGKLYEKLHSPFYPNFDKVLFHECLEEFEISLNCKLNKISFGQKKKFLLSFAFASGCELVIMDEPTNSLDIPSKSQFRKILAKTASEDRTFIISTHQVRDLENLIDPIIILEEGKIIFNQYLEEVEEKLNIHHVRKEPKEDSVLFYEKKLGGYAVVTEKNDEIDEDYQIELETLFNTVINNPEKIQRIFSKE